MAVVASVAQPAGLPELRVPDPAGGGHVPKLRMDRPDAPPISNGAGRGVSQEESADVVDGVPHWMRRHLRRRSDWCHLPDFCIEFVHESVQPDIEELA